MSNSNLRLVQAIRRSLRISFRPAKDVYSWSRLTRLDAVKVVVIGQDPYHGPGQGVEMGVPRIKRPNTLSHPQVKHTDYPSQCETPYHPLLRSRTSTSSSRTTFLVSRNQNRGAIVLSAYSADMSAYAGTCTQRPDCDGATRCAVAQYIIDGSGCTGRFAFWKGMGGMSISLLLWGSSRRLSKTKCLAFYRPSRRQFSKLS